MRFKNQGLESIEVQDNGDGISPNNYETLALKHHTSKLSSYADLTTLQTFGFRGEALSSLCALSKFSVVTCLAKDAPKGTKLNFEQSGKLKGQSVVAAQKGTTVTVEDLFHNLPVRKRELAKNIKREWNKVIGHLQQYACIQTGIKFTVTSQVGKGKKTTMFATKGNQTTRENLVNVFGAKTLAALVALDLELELEATSGPNQRWSTQDDGGKKEIKIVGHMSRPAYGEGRQTPDRQMFFVNGRPCALPQFAKAFNEVYKSYNSHQSPFIFANIELDTHLYDVNVSPDKRTILLHDQTRMLDSLKAALTELFEKQEYTVPISQLPSHKQPAFKQLTLSRESTDMSMMSNASTQSIVSAAEEEEIEPEVQHVHRRGEYNDDEDEPSARATEVGGKAVSRTTISTDSGSISLISNWMNGKATDRVDSKTPGAKVAPQPQAGLSKDKRLLVEKFRREAEQGKESDDVEDVPDDLFATTQSTQISPSIPLSRPVQDFNARLAELDVPQKVVREMVRAPLAAPPSQDEIEGDSEDREVPIPSLQSSPRPPPSIADRYEVTPRMPRAPLGMATITIDGETTVSPIGSPVKRSKATNSARSNSSTKIWGRNSRISSFGNKLSQRFGAPGTAPDTSAEDEEDGSDEESGSEVQDVHQESSQQSDDAKEVDADGDCEDEAALHGHNSTCGCDTEERLVTTKEFAEADDDAYVDEEQQRLEEAARVKALTNAAEESARVKQSQDNLQRANAVLKGSKKKDSTIDLVRKINIGVSSIEAQYQILRSSLAAYDSSSHNLMDEDEGLESTRAEEKLSLTISKSDFARMRIVGQFNLGFILATRAPTTGLSSTSPEDFSCSSDLFIIDQHASDEKYNFERFSSTTILQSQPLVTPKTLDLTALEEELVQEHQSTLIANGFKTSFDESGTSPVGQRVKLLALPLSHSITFNLSDLEELLSLLSDAPASSHSSTRNIIRPSKVRKMFAMRACRSSIMIGRTLTRRQMGKVVGNLGDLDKPWNCPHGRPTMRHLCGLGVWDSEGWKGDVEDGDAEGVGRSVGEWVRRMKSVRDRDEEEDLDDGEEGGLAENEYYAMHDDDSTDEVY